MKGQQSVLDYYILLYCSQLTVLTKKTVGKAEFSRSLIFISATIIWKQLVVPSGLWRLSSVVREPRASTEESHHRFEQIL